MALSYIGQATGTDSCTLPAHQTDDLLIAFAFRDGSNTAPSLPSGWESILSGGANSASSILGWKKCASSSETSGTWTNATSLAIHVYRGQDLTDPIGASAQLSASNTTVLYEALTLQNSSGSSHVAGFAAHRQVNTSLETPPTGMTNRSTNVDATDEIAGHDTNGGVTSWSQQSVSVGGTSGVWRSATVELLAGSANHVCNLPSGAVTPIAAQSGLSLRLTESTALPTGAVLDIDGVAPSVRLTESSAFPAGAVLDIDGFAPTLDLTLDLTSALPAAAVVALQGNAPTERLTENTALVAGVVAVQGAAPSARVTESSALVAGVVALSAAAPTFQLTTGLESNLPSGALLRLIGAAPTLQLTSLAAPVQEVVPAGAFAPTYDAILWPPQWTPPRLSIVLLPAGKVEVQGHAPGFRLSDNVRSLLPTERFVLIPGQVWFRMTEHVRAELPPANFSTRGHAPAILISTDGISEAELSCLMLL